MVNKRFLEMALKMKNEGTVLDTRGAPDISLMNEKEAKGIRKGIVDRIGFEGSFIKEGVGNHNLFTNTNASFGILSYLVGEEQEALKIMCAINNEIGFEENLVKIEKDNSVLMTNTNANWGILNYLLGYNKEATKIRDVLSEKIPFDRGFLMPKGVDFCNSFDSSYVLMTDCNATFATLDYLLGYKDEARNIKEAIVKRIKLENGLIRESVHSSDLLTHSNATFGTLCHLLGEENETKKIREGIVKKIRFDCDLIKYGVNSGGINTYSNSTLGILYVADKLKKIHEERNGK